MKNNLLRIVQYHNNPLAVQRAHRLLRLRYGITLPRKAEQRDPVWLSAYNQ